MSAQTRPILLGCQDLSKAYGAEPLFTGLSFSIHEGDHIGLVGPNGAGKSTLLRILAGEESADSGSVIPRKSLRLGYMPQHPEFAIGLSVEAVVRQSLARDARFDADQRDHQVSVALSLCGFTETGTSPDMLSGGWRARLALARAIAPEPDLLLLDEPTNHLDIESILWLESFLKARRIAFVAVSHDRYFLQNVARRMIDIDRVYPAGLLSVDGAYADLLETRDELLSQQASYQESLGNRVRREVAWLRRGAKARTSKARSRIDAAERSIEELEQTRQRTRVTRTAVDLSGSGRKTKRLWEARGIAKAFGDQPILRDLDLLLRPGTRLGVIGANGSGKTTLLKLIVGEIEPDAGEIQQADRLRVAYFDQDRKSLDTSLTLKRALAPEGDAVIYRDRPVHIVTWAKRFGFTREQLGTRVEKLSGGERARIALARLMLRPADLLVLDEPTNDLDIATLEVLEESLLEFEGALVLVIHDRHVIERVATELVALDGKGGAERFADYRQWERSRNPAAVRRPGKKVRAADRPAPRPKKKLSYHEQRELDGIEEKILAAETALDKARIAAEDPSISTDAARLQQTHAALADAQANVDRLYARWAELDTGNR